MGLEAVKEEVIRQAKGQESALIAEARKDANRVSREAEKKVQEMQEKSDAETKKQIDSIKRQALASADMENKKMILEAKKQVIETVFKEAKTKLEADEKKREAYVKKLIETAKKEIDVGNIYCSKKDLKFLKGLNAEPADISGGIIAENKDKTIRVDYAFETMLETIKEREMQDINKILFG